MPGVVIARDRNNALAVKAMRAYGRFIIDHAEAMVGEIGSGEWIAEDGLTVSFTVKCNPDAVPTVNVTHKRLALEVIDALEAEKCQS